MFKQRQAMAEKIQAFNVINATMDVDVTNPMLFDVSAMKKKYENGEHLSGGLTVEQVKKWKSVYTTYFNSALSLKEGRRVHQDKCCENPNINMLKMAVDRLGLRSVIEPFKKHPRDFWGHGRLKIELVDGSGRPVNSSIGTSKRKLFEAIGNMIPEALVQYEDTLAAEKAEVKAR